MVIQNVLSHFGRATICAVTFKLREQIEILDNNNSFIKSNIKREFCGAFINLFALFKLAV